jgi:hypothetical protein
MWPKSIESLRQDAPRGRAGRLGAPRGHAAHPVSAKWVIDPNGASRRGREFVARRPRPAGEGQDPKPPCARAAGSRGPEHLRLALLELVYGHSFFEQVYRRPDGRAHLAKLAWRPPRTISDIKVAPRRRPRRDRAGRRSGGQRPITIPVERLVAYVNEREGGNWLGQSLLRHGVQELAAEGPDAPRSGADGRAQRARRAGLHGRASPGRRAPDEREGVAGVREGCRPEAREGFRAGEAAGASIPNGRPRAEGRDGQAARHRRPIRYHDEQIARAVLAHFLNLGTETGSWALGSTFANFFTDSLNAVAAHIADVTQQHVVEDLVDLNWGDAETPAPRLTFDPIGSEQPATAEAIKALVDCGRDHAGPESSRRTCGGRLRAAGGLRPDTQQLALPKEQP